MWGTMTKLGVWQGYARFRNVSKPKPGDVTTLSQWKQLEQHELRKWLNWARKSPTLTPLRRPLYKATPPKSIVMNTKVYCFHTKPFSVEDTHIQDWTATSTVSFFLYSCRSLWFRCYRDIKSVFLTNRTKNSFKMFIKKWNKPRNLGLLLTAASLETTGLFLRETSESELTLLVDWKTLKLIKMRWNERREYQWISPLEITVNRTSLTDMTLQLMARSVELKKGMLKLWLFSSSSHRVWWGGGSAAHRSSEQKETKHLTVVVSVAIIKSLSSPALILGAGGR